MMSRLKSESRAGLPDKEQSRYHATNLREWLESELDIEMNG
jgi:hypothetical protein